MWPWRISSRLKTSPHFMQRPTARYSSEFGKVAKNFAVSLLWQLQQPERQLDHTKP